MSALKGRYKCLEGTHVRCGVSCFSIPKHATVNVLQVDTENSKVLIHFGGRDSDWYSISFLNNNFERIGE